MRPVTVRVVKTCSVKIEGRIPPEVIDHPQKLVDVLRNACLVGQEDPPR